MSESVDAELPASSVAALSRAPQGSRHLCQHLFSSAMAAFYYHEYRIVPYFACADGLDSGATMHYRPEIKKRRRFWRHSWVGFVYCRDTTLDGARQKIVEDKRWRYERYRTDQLRRYCTPDIIYEPTRREDGYWFPRLVSSSRTTYLLAALRALFDNDERAGRVDFELEEYDD